MSLEDIASLVLIIIRPRRTNVRQTFSKRRGTDQVNTFVEMFEMEIVEKRGLVADDWSVGITR